MISIFFVLFTINPTEGNLTRNPYLQSVQKDSVIAMQKTDFKIQKYILKYGENPKKLNFKSTACYFEHADNFLNEATAKNLKPNTKYYYAIKMDGKDVISEEDYYCISAPRKSKAFSYYTIGDIGSKGSKEGSVASKSAYQIDQ